jgi:tetratricopeptide (TPR) repeat protein
MEAVNQGFLSSTDELAGTPARQSRWASLIARSKRAVARRRLAEAAGYLEEALEMARDDWPNSQMQAESSIRLADLCAALDRRDDALRLYGEGVGVLGELPDGVTGLLAHAVSNIGRMFLLKGEQAKGHGLAAAADAMQRKLGEPDRPSIKLNLAMALAHTGDDTGAQQAFKAAVATLESLDPDDLQGIAVHDNYALYCLSRELVEDAEVLLRHCLILRQEVAGPRHPVYAGGLVNLARLLHVYGGAREEAEALFWQAKDICERGRGTTASGILPALYYLARIAQQNQRNAEAGRLCNAMLEHGVGDERFARAAEAASLHVTARLWAADGSEVAETEKRLSQALELAESLDGGYRRLGVDIAADTLADLSGLMLEENRAPEAERLANRAAEMRGRLLWATSRHVFMAPD